MKRFRTYLKHQGLSDNTINSYLYGVNYFVNNYKLNYDNLLKYKNFLIDNFKPKTVNLRIQSINRYLEFINKIDLKIRAIKIQNKSYLENVISNADYLFFKRKLKITGFYKWYYIVWFLTATGARISELIKIKIEHIQLGYFDVYSKSGKTRRLYIPSKLSLSLKKWLLEEKRDSGYLFLYKYNNSISSRGVSQGLKKFAKKFGLDTNVVYPHSFRHLYAKNFLEKFNDISLLADIMGHESIETTRIYLRKTFSEQQKIIDSVVDW